MADRVEIVVTANDSASQILRGIGSQLGGLGTAISSIANGDIVGLTSQVIEFGKESIKTFTDGAQAAKQLSLVSGESIENTSRFIQVLDDYEISQQDALAATKALTKEGLSPTIETLAKLSDQYRAIQDPEKKNQFIIENLGRAGLQWAKVLDQGSEALYQQAGAIDNHLIYTEEMYQQAEELRLAQDQLNDTWEATKIQIGNELVPVLAKFLEISNKVDAGISIWAKDTEKATDATETNTNAVADNTIELEKSSEQLKAEADAIKALTERYQGYLDLASGIFSEQVSYEEELNGLTKEKIKLEEEYNSLSEEGWDKNREKLEDNLKAYDDVNTKINELKEDHRLAMGQMQYDLLLTKLSVDGLTTAEFNMATEAGIAFGVFDRESADAAIAMNNLTEKVAAGRISVYEYGQIIDKAMADGVIKAEELASAIFSIPDEKTFTLNIVQNHIMPGGEMENIGWVPGQAGGGDIKAGNLYRVNETRMEYFKPSMNGTVIPLGGGKGGGGDTYNITLSPTVMVGDRSRAANELAPIIIDGIRKAKADKII